MLDHGDLLGELDPNYLLDADQSFEEVINLYGSSWQGEKQVVQVRESNLGSNPTPNLGFLPTTGLDLIPLFRARTAIAFLGAYLDNQELLNQETLTGFLGFSQEK
jgi:hypothetical protein